MRDMNEVRAYKVKEGRRGKRREEEGRRGKKKEVILFCPYRIFLQAEVR